MSQVGSGRRFVGLGGPGGDLAETRHAEVNHGRRASLLSIELAKFLLGASEAKLTQLDGRSTIHLGMPDLSRIASHTLGEPEPDRCPPGGTETQA